MKFSRWKSGKLSKLNIITGTNEVGKSTILRAITEGLTRGGVPPEHITIGEDKAKVAIEIDGQFLIESTATAKGSYRKITDNGKPVSAPQQFLDRILGRMGSVNPVDILTANTADRREMILAALPLELPADAIDKAVPNGVNVDYVKEPLAVISRMDKTIHPLDFLEKAAKVVYDARTGVNRELDKKKKSVEALAETLPQIDFSEFEGFDPDKRMANLEEANARIAEHENLRRTIQGIEQGVADRKDRIQRLRAEIVTLENEIGTGESSLQQYRSQYDAFVAPNTDVIKDEISRYNKAQAAIGQKRQLDSAQAEIGALSDESEALSAFLKGITLLPTKILAGAKLPVIGLEIRANDIYLGGIPFDDLSTGQKVNLAVDIGIAAAGPLKVLCVDRFECMGKEFRERFEAKIDESDVEAFVTITTSEGELNVESKGE